MNASTGELENVCTADIIFVYLGSSSDKTGVTIFTETAGSINNLILD